MSHKQSLPNEAIDIEMPGSPINCADNKLYSQQLNSQQTDEQPAQNRSPIIRHSRAFRHFKNPPQPHMCIRDHTIDGQELFINVMSWTRIVMPVHATDPIPLYGGMRVLPGSPRSPPLVYAVMANPDILKHVGRNCPDPEEKLALVELMCDFVEAMNPGLKLARNAEVLKDRDLSGELKDIWGAVQAKREREKDDAATYAAPSYENYMSTQNQMTCYMEFGPETGFPQQQSPQIQNPSTKDQHTLMSNKTTLISAINTNDKINVNEYDNSNSKVINMSQYGMELADNKILHPDTLDGLDNNVLQVEKNIDSKDDTIDTISNVSAIPNTQSPSNGTSSLTNISNPSPTPIVISTQIHNNKTSVANTVVSTPVTAKKEKLASFLPNGCHHIFPFIKSKSCQEKKEKEREKSEKNQTKDKSRSTSFKKSTKSNSGGVTDNDDNTNTTQNIVKSLETEIAKIDLKTMQSDNLTFAEKESFSMDKVQSKISLTTSTAAK